MNPDTQLDQHEHDWISLRTVTDEDDPQVCECGAARVVRLCIVCYAAELEPTEARTCVGCLSRTRSALEEIVQLYALLPAELADHVGAARPPGSVGRPDSDGIPEVLALASGGSNGTVTASRHGDRSHAADNWASDAPAVLAELASWEDDWRGSKVAEHRATVVTSAAYLLEHLSWAAQNHDAFDEFAAEVRRLREQLRQANRAGVAVERGVPCPYCGTQLRRVSTKPKPCDHPTPERDFRGDCHAGTDSCGHDESDPEHWDGGWEPYELYAERLDHHWEMHARHDQGGRREDWRCPNRECSREFDERRYYLAVLVNWRDVQSERDVG